MRAEEASAMKWNEMSVFQKTIFVLGFICAFTYFILSVIELFNLATIPKAIPYLLFAAFWVSLSITQSDKKLAKWYTIAAAGYVLLALLYIFF